MNAFSDKSDLGLKFFIRHILLKKSLYEFTVKSTGSLVARNTLKLQTG